MRALLGLVVVSLLALPMPAEPVVQQVAPTKGVPTGGTLVMIYGSDLIPEALTCRQGSTGFCPGLRASFGGASAIFHSATPSYVYVYAPGGVGTVDIRLEVEGRPNLTLPNAFTFDEHAPPTPNDTVRYLVPITTHEQPGLNGSLWTSELTLFTSGFSRAMLRGRFCDESSLALCTSILDLERDVSTRVRLYSATGGEGAFLYVPRAASGDIVRQLRARDIARDRDNFGSEIPVVDVNRDFGPNQRLLDVPVDPRYRALLRVYAQDDRSDRIVVTVYPPNGTEPIESYELGLAGRGAASDFPLNPGYVAVDPISDAVRASGHQRVRVEVEATFLWDPPPSFHIWAFISLTNNETNQFTVITPQR
ncbi:MAG TPA: IPT/TIG domain-containing protein [Thermoanaerobaculia bacterium]